MEGVAEPDAYPRPGPPKLSITVHAKVAIAQTYGHRLPPVTLRRQARPEGKRSSELTQVVAVA